MIYNDENFELLLPQGPVSQFGELGCLPRQTLCGSNEARECGLTPLEESLEPVPQAEWKAVIEECHAKKIFPMYHRADATDLEQKPSQNGLNFCWSWSLRACLENVRLIEGQKPVKLAPISLGWLVSWRNAGYYLDASIKGVSERGMASSEFCPSQYDISRKSFKTGWETDALNYRVSEWWDIDCRKGAVSTISQCLAILRTGRPVYNAYSWWGHATAIFGFDWNTKQSNNIVWKVMNSHADGLIDLAGSKGIIDEGYGPRASSFPASK